MVERRFYTPKVKGSIPLAATNLYKTRNCRGSLWAVSSMVEHVFDSHDTGVRFPYRLPMPEKTWEELLREARATLRQAHDIMDDIAGWSGSSGNWGLHESLPVVKEALDLLDSLSKPEIEE